MGPVKADEKPVVLTDAEKAAAYDLLTKGKGNPTLKAAQAVQLAVKSAVASLTDINIKHATVRISDGDVEILRITLRKRAYVPLSDERREALTEQLAKARAARAEGKASNTGETGEGETANTVNDPNAGTGDETETAPAKGRNKGRGK